MHLLEIKRWIRHICKIITLGDLTLICFTVPYKLFFNSFGISIFPFLSSIAKKFEKKITEHIKKRNLVAEFYGKKFYFPDLSALYVLDEEYEKETFNLLNDLLTEETVFVDIGAHVGKYCVTLSERAHAVIAIEPDPINYSFLQKNCSTYSNIYLYNVACYNRCGTISFSLEGPSINRRIIDKELHDMPKREVRARTLDSIIKELEYTLSFSKLILKIDVEGAEHLVIFGAKEVIEKYRPIIVCEVWEDNFKEIVKFLSKYNYEYEIIEVNPIQALFRQGLQTFKTSRGR
ncbi:MAG: FkbM family methyltransferase [Candidatus Bathyarchaeia archaeon]